MQNPEFYLISSALILRSPKEEDWEELSSYLCKVQRSIYWWIGDYFRFGEARFGDDIYQYIDETMSPQLIERCAKVASEFPHSERFDTLSWTHHYIVMPLSKPLRKAVLTMAETDRWDTAKTREYVNKLRKDD